MEKVKFENTCELLLEGMVSAEKMKYLVSGRDWEEDEFQDLLRQRLRPQDIQTIIGAMEELRTYLQELVDRIGADNIQLDGDNKGHKCRLITNNDATDEETFATTDAYRAVACC
ncbi:hypothetical protein K440DRAFT_644329 [Wilcoxina mikolae CBS 423.85]|nr:hypothetical protein K440DRAFT_644329 [Wilcoxina mikolae CBS 423.85]